MCYNDISFCEKTNEIVFSNILWTQSIDSFPQKYDFVRQIAQSNWFACFSRNDYTKYIELLNCFFDNDNELGSIISFASFEKKVLAFFFEHYERNHPLTADCWNKFIAVIKKNLHISHEIFYPWPRWMIFAKPPFSINHITWYLKDDLIAKNVKFQHAVNVDPALVRDFQNVNQIIGIKCDTVDDNLDTAWLFADIQYSRLCSLFYAMLPSVKKIDSPLEAQVHSRVDAILVTSNRSCTRPSPHNQQPAFPVSIDPILILMIQALCKNIKNMTWQEKRFLTAVTLIGKGRSVCEHFEEFLLCASGIEALVKMGRKTNITDQFKKHSATLLSIDHQEQERISKEMGRLYNTRSDIAHGKSLTVSANDLSEIQLYATRILISFFDCTRTMNREEKYSEFITNRCTLPISNKAAKQ